ncbi:UTP--glucose-1-phosphate uridylyltransferase, partial [Streptococcus equi]
MNGTHKEPQIKEELMTKVRKAIIPTAGLGTRFL